MTVAAVLAHAGVLLTLWFVPGGARGLFWLNLAIATTVLLFAVSRVRFIVAARDVPYLALLFAELAVLALAIWALRGNRAAAVGSYVACGLHGLVSLAGAIFAFAFKMTRLM